MKEIRKALWIALALLPCTLARADDEAPVSLDKSLEPIRAKHDIPALAAAFVEGKDLRAIGAIGVRKKGEEAAKVEIDDRFHLGSCTKSMTATLAAILVEKKKIQWTTTVTQCFPELAQKIHADYRSVTLEDFLAHRSGLPEDRKPDPKIWSRIVRLRGPLPESRRELVRIVLEPPPATKPGTAHAYSNAGYTIAGAMLERASGTGRSYEDLVRALIFRPLEMKTAGFGPPGDARKLAEPWGHGPGLLGAGMTAVAPGPKADNPAVIGPAGTAHASIGDWAKYASLHLRGARGEKGLLLEPESFTKLHTDVAGQEYALGWAVAEREWAGGPVLMHSGSNGLWYATIWIAPKRNAAFVATSNCGTEAGAKACDDAVAAMIEEFLGGVDQNF